MGSADQNAEDGSRATDTVRHAAGWAVESVARDAGRAPSRDEWGFAEAVIDTAGALVLVLDRRGRIVRFNRACEALTGYRFDEVRGRVFWDLFLLPDELARVREVFALLCAGRFPNEHMNHWRTRGGEHRLIAWKNTALPDAAGEPEFIVAIGEDVTALREAEAHAETLAEAAPIGLARVDLTGRVLEANPAAGALLGYGAGELRGMNFGEYTYPEDIAEGRRLFRELAAGRLPGDRYEREKRYVRKDGRVIWGRTISSLVRDTSGRPRYVIGMLEEITARKEAEAAQAKLQSVSAIIGAIPVPSVGTAPATTGRHATGADAALLQHLTAGDRKLLDLLARGWENDEIANALSVTAQTVRNHCHDLYGKIGVGSRGKAIVWAIKHGFGED